MIGRSSIINLFFIIFLSHFFSGKAQFYNTGQDPSSVKWNQIRTEHFQIIYPKDFYFHSNRFANVLEHIYESSCQGLDHNPKRIPIVLHTQSVLSNGYVVWAPKRMEVVTTPPQSSYALDWLEQLAVHELRHVIQVDKLNQGFTKILSIPFGQMAPGAMTGFLPFWFLEGDAVVNETVLTKTGRGRLSSFSMPLKAIEAEMPERYSYDQSYLGSYRYYIPDYYRYGYFMTSHARINFNQEVWSNTLDYVGKKPFTLAPFYFGLKKETGLSKTGLYHSTFDKLRSAWPKPECTNSGSEITTPENKFFTSYRYPVQIGKDSIIAVKSSIEDITRFVLVTGKTEKTIHTPGPFTSSPLAVSGNYIAWQETGFDPRWEQRSYSNIKIIHRTSGKIVKLQSQSRHFSPAISPDEKKIALIRNDEYYHSIIEIFDIQNPVKMMDAAHPDGYQLSYPEWLNDTIIVLVALSKQGKSIYKVDLHNNKWENVFGPTLGNITKPVCWNNYLIFNYDIEDQNNIYAVDLTSSQLFKITESQYGAFDPSVNPYENKLLYTCYTIDGYKPFQKDLDTTYWKRTDPGNQNINARADSLFIPSMINLQDTNLSVKEYEPKNYNSLLNTFNIHSWLPFYFDRDNIQELLTGESTIYPGLTLLSQNKTSTVMSYISYYYAENEHHFYPEISIRAWYPVIDIGLDIGGRTSVYNYQEFEETRDTSLMRKYFHTKISLPLNFTGGKYFTYAIPYIKYSFTNNFYKEGDVYSQGGDVVEYSLSFSNLLKKSYRDIKPKWGQTLFLSHSRISPYYTNYEKNNLIQARFYFPGLFHHHSFYFSAGYEEYSNRLAMPRGYRDQSFLLDYYIFNTNYSLPILYPDLTIGPLAYIKRIQANLFYDYADYHYYARINNQVMRIDNSTASLGIELGVESNFLRFIIPVTPTLRYSYRLDDKKSTFGLYFTYSVTVF